MNSNQIEEYKKALKLTDFQREVLIGVLLGDGCLETNNSGRTYRLKIEHSVKQKEYVEHLYNIFREWIRQEINVRTKELKNKTYENLNFSTLSHESLRFYAQQFYDDKGEKRVPKIINKLLNPVSLAYWFMDDGSIKSNQSKGIILNTHGFRVTDIRRLIIVLNKKFGLDCKERKQKEGSQIYISGKSGESFIKLILDYLIPEMFYKIPFPIRRTYLPKR